MFDTIEAGSACAAGLLVGAAESHRAVARAQHAEMVAVAQFCRLRAELDIADPALPEDTLDKVHFEAGEFARSEVAVALGVSVFAAGRLAETGDALGLRPCLSAAFAAGEVDLARVRTVLEATAEVDPERLHQVDEATTAAARAHHSSGLSARVRRIITRLDPDAARRRRETAERGRYVGTQPVPDGMAALFGRLRGHDALVLDRRLDDIAAGTCAADPRTKDAQRADALMALIYGTPTGCGCDTNCDGDAGRSDGPDCGCTTETGCGCGGEAGCGCGGEAGCGCGAEHRGHDTPTPRGELTVLFETLTGSSDAPADLVGHGPIDPTLARILAACADQVRLAHVHDGTIVDSQAVRYRPGTDLGRTVRLRDHTCRFPGCHRRATHPDTPIRAGSTSGRTSSAPGCTDLDHMVPFRHDDPRNGGLTTWENLFSLCRHHHRAKTLRIWTYHHLGHGVLEWTSPTGTTHLTRPPPVDDEAPPF